jgi:hypothetical protein
VKADLVDALLERYGDHPAVTPGRRARGRISAVHLSHRWEGRLILVLFLPRRPQPWLVIKSDRRPNHARRQTGELASLREVAANPELAGSVPEPVGQLYLPQGPALVQTGLPGSPLTSVLRRRLPKRIESGAVDDLEHILAWYGRFARWDAPDGRVRVELDTLPERIASVIGDDRAPFLERLRSESAGVPAVDVPLIRGHGDLSPSNLLLHRGRVRAVDWEADTTHQQRLPDVVVSLNNLIRATPVGGKLPSRAGAAFRAFVGGRPLGRLTRRYWDRILAEVLRVDGPSDLLLLDSMVRLAGGGATDDGTDHRDRGQRLWAEVVDHLVTRLGEEPARWPLRR